MFVVEDRHDASGRLEEANGFLEETVTGIERLPFLVPGILAMFTDDHHPIDSQLGPALRERLGNGGIDGRAVPARTVPAQIALWKLIDIERGQFHWGIM